MALPSAPSGLCVYSTLDALCFQLNWSAVDGVSGYNVYYSSVYHSSYVPVGQNIPGLTFFHNPQNPRNLNLENRWFYGVTAYNAFGEGPISDRASYDPYYQLIDTNVPRPPSGFWDTIN